MATIVLDAGHGGYDYGATNGSRYEKNDNLRLAQAVASILRAQGQNVVMTRNSDVFIPLTERSAISNAAKADLFVSLHRNGSTNPAANGVETFIHTSASQRALEAATNIQNAVVSQGVQSDRGVKRADFSVLRNTYAPAVLHELGFITNAEDNLLFDANFSKYAEAIAGAILKSLGIPSTTPPPSGSAVIRAIQDTLNSRYNAGLATDGILGPRTKQAVIRGLQIELNSAYNAGLVTDGVFGPKTKEAIRPVRRGMSGNIVYLLQAALYFKGYQIAVDGAFGPATENAVRQFQTANGLVPDGVAGKETFAALLK